LGIELKNGFTVAVPPETTYSALLDVGRVAPCIPGARVLGRHTDGGYEAEMSLKLGPMNMVFAGQIVVVEQDDRTRRAVYRGSATERKGRGTASATVVLLVQDATSGSAVSVTTDLGVSGRVAQMGRGVMEGVAGQLIRTMAGNLETMLMHDPDDPFSPAQSKPPQPSLKVGSLMAGAVKSKLLKSNED
jgi:carbon monoxide dehydrogenase subunit G